MEKYVFSGKTEEEASRFTLDDEMQTENDNMDISENVDEDKVVDTAEDVKGQALNGAQTQILILIMDKFSEGKLNEAQAINMISTAIGVSKDKAREIVQGL